jgi:hypothetical protein
LDAGTGTVPLAGIPELSLAKLPKGTLNYLLLGQGAGVDPIYGAFSDTIHGTRASGLHADSHTRLHALTPDNVDHSKADMDLGGYDVRGIVDVEADRILLDRTNKDVNLYRSAANVLSLATGDKFQFPAEHKFDKIGLYSGYVWEIGTEAVTMRFSIQDDITRYFRWYGRHNTTDTKVMELSVPAGNLWLLGYGDLGSLRIGGTEVITSARALQNLTAPASLITSGRFGMARMPDGTLNYLLLGQGAGVNPAYGAFSDTIHGSRGSGLHADSHTRSHDHSLAADGSPIALAGVPTIPYTKTDFADQAVKTTSSPTFANLTVSGNIYALGIPSADKYDDLKIIDSIQVRDDNLELPSNFKSINQLIGLLIGSIKQLREEVEELRREVECRKSGCIDGHPTAD